MKISENPIVLTQLSKTDIETYQFKYGEYTLPGTEEKAPYRVNIVFVDGKFSRLEFLDFQEKLDLNNLPIDKIFIMDAIATKIKEIESVL